EHVDDERADRMQQDLARMRKAITAEDVTEYLDEEEALLLTLYRAGGNDVLAETIRGLWQQCRVYKVVGAHAAMRDGQAASLWQYQERLVTMARDRDPTAVSAVVEESLNDATDRIRTQLAEQDA